MIAFAQMGKPDHLLNAFGRNVRRIREAKDLTQEALAEKADLDRTTKSACNLRHHSLTLCDFVMHGTRLRVSTGTVSPFGPPGPPLRQEGILDPTSTVVPRIPQDRLKPSTTTLQPEEQPSHPARNPRYDHRITKLGVARPQSCEDPFTSHSSDDSKMPTENIGVGLDMAGEAVPPIRAKAVAETVVARLEEKGH
jgi:transcriptional regulator with XRE-family HTH domain